MHPRRTRLGGCCALASCLISSCSPCSLCRFTARSCDCCALLLALFPCPATCSLARLYCWRLDDWFASREPCVHGNATRRRLSALPSNCTALRCLLHATACSPAVPLVFARMRVPRVAPLLCAVSTGRVRLFCSPCNWVCGVCLSRSSFYARVLRTAMRCPSFASFPLLRTHLSGALALPAMRANANSAGQSGSGNDAAEGGYAHYGATVAWRRLPHRGVVPLVAWDTSFSCDSRVIHLT